MKRFIAGIVCGVLLVTLSMTVLAETKKRVEVIFGQVKLVVDGKSVREETLLYNGVTYVPLRAAAEALGVSVEWDGGTQTARLTSGGQAIQTAPAQPAAPSAPAPSTNDNIVFYKDHPLVPDMGAFYGIEASYTSYSGNMISYKVSDIKDLKPYYDLIESLGFKFIEIADDGDLVYGKDNMTIDIGPNEENEDIDIFFWYN